MSDLILRNTKGAPLTFTELDNNLVQASAIRYNAVSNGRFSIWQRKKGTGLYDLADGWFYASNSNDTFIYSQGSDPEYATGLNTAVTAGGVSGANDIHHRMEDVTTFAGMPVTCSFICTSNKALTLTIRLLQNFGAGGSPIVPVDINVSVAVGRQRVTFTTTLPSVSGKTFGTDHFLDLVLGLPSNDSYAINFTDVSLQSGAVYSPVEAPTPASTFTWAQRQFQKSYLADTQPGTVTEVGVVKLWLDQDFGTSVFLPTTMRGTPTITIYSPVTGTAGKAYDEIAGADYTPIVSNAGPQSFVITAAGGHSGPSRFHYSASARL